MKTHAIIVAAGAGSRTGRAGPKQFEPVAGKPLYQWSLDILLAHEGISTVVLVVPAALEPGSLPLPASSKLRTVSGSDTRTGSVRNGLLALDADEEDIVLIHDAARPGLSASIVTALIEEMKTADAAAPALPVSDALKRRTGETLSSISRDGLFRVQTPQAFRYHVILKALEQESAALVDDLAAVEHLGVKVSLIAGSERLGKVTYEEDFSHLETVMTASRTPTVRMGSGYDVHGFEPGDHVTLCGVRISHEQGLSGHSDADVGWHALTDAIFGALALGDLGDHFPPSDPKWKGADSRLFLEHALTLAAEQGWQLGNCDITLICEAPKVKPHRLAMREATAAVTGLPVDCISIKATTTEGLGFTGRREGIAGQAVAVLCRID